MVSATTLELRLRFSTAEKNFLLKSVNKIYTKKGHPFFERFPVPMTMDKRRNGNHRWTNEANTGVHNQAKG